MYAKVEKCRVAMEQNDVMRSAPMVGRADDNTMYRSVLKE